MTLLKDPLGYFEELLQRGGLQSLHERFKPSQEDIEYLDIGYDEVEMCKVYSDRDPATGEIFVERDFFQDYLRPILDDEVFEVRRRLNTQLDSTNSSRRRIVENFIIRLKYFIGKAGGLKENDSSLIAKLPIIRQHLISLLKDIESTYGHEFAIRAPNVSSTEDQLEVVGVPKIPYFNKRALPDLLKFIQDFFDVGDHSYLKDLLEAGDRPPKMLCFNGSGNRLADAFKQLITTDLITQCNKKELEQWMLIHFSYNSKGCAKAYNKRTLNKIISTNDITSACKNPLFEIITDENGDRKLTHIA